MVNQAVNLHRKHPSDQGISIGMLLDERLTWFDVVRKPNHELHGFWKRIADLLTERASRAQLEVRGHLVAADTLVDALISHGAVDRYDVFTYPWAKTSLSSRLHLHKYVSNGSRKIRILSLEEAVKAGKRDFDITAWFNPMPHDLARGGLEISHRVRSSHAMKIYPVTTLLHGLSMDRMLYNGFLHYLLYGPLACDSIICTSHASREAIRKILEHLTEQFNRTFGTELHHQGRLDLIPLCVNTSELRPENKQLARRRMNLALDSFAILMLGRLSPLKADLCPFLQVFKQLVVDNPTKKLTWILAGTEERGYVQFLQNCARELGIAHCLRVWKNVSDKSRRILFSCADVLISPSDSVQESFGLTPIEAMACGVPQVVPDWNGYRDTVCHGETGFLIPTYWSNCCSDLRDTAMAAGSMYDHLCLGQSVAMDMRKTREYLQCLIDNEELRTGMARRSRERALSKYSFRVIAEQYVALWTELATIAKNIEQLPRTVEFDRPVYYNFFGQYAARILDDGSHLRITPLGMQVMNTNLQLQLQPGLLSSFRVLEEDLLRDALEKSVTFRELTMRELLQLIGQNRSNHTDHLRRHIMWLIKYGYLEPVLDS